MYLLGTTFTRGLIHIWCTSKTLGLTMGPPECLIYVFSLWVLVYAKEV